MDRKNLNSDSEETDDLDKEILVKMKSSLLCQQGNQVAGAPYDMQQALIDVGPAKKQNSLLKRIVVGFWVASGFFMCFSQGLAGMMLHPYVMFICIFSDLTGLNRRPALDHYWLELQFPFLGLFITAPDTQWRRDLLEASGLSAETNPWLFSVLYEYHAHVVIVWTSILFMAVACTLKRGQLKYQLGCYGNAAISAIYCTFVAFCGASTGWMGRYWYIFPMIMVTFNDVNAFFVGRFFGRTKLIRLSPKKTWEGYIGGMVTCVLLTLYFAKDLDSSQYFICPHFKYETAPFYY